MFQYAGSKSHQECDHFFNKAGKNGNIILTI